MNLSKNWQSGGSLKKVNDNIFISVSYILDEDRWIWCVYKKNNMNGNIKFSNGEKYELVKSAYASTEQEGKTKAEEKAYDLGKSLFK